MRCLQSLSLTIKVPGCTSLQLCFSIPFALQIWISSGCCNLHGNCHISDKLGKHPTALHYCPSCWLDIWSTLESRACTCLRIFWAESLWAELLRAWYQHHCDVILRLQYDCELPCNFILHNNPLLEVHLCEGGWMSALLSLKLCRGLCRAWHKSTIWLRHMRRGNWSELINIPQFLTI